MMDAVPVDASMMTRGLEVDLTAFPIFRPFRRTPERTVRARRDEPSPLRPAEITWSRVSAAQPPSALRLLPAVVAREVNPESRDRMSPGTPTY